MVTVDKTADPPDPRSKSVLPIGMPAEIGSEVAPIALGVVSYLAKVVLLAAIMAYVESRVRKVEAVPSPRLAHGGQSSSMIGVVFHFL